MPISCDPSSLAAAAACYCYDAQMMQAVQIVLLREIAGSTLTPEQLSAAARCFCFDTETQAKVKNLLLCELSNA